MSKIGIERNSGIVPDEAAEVLLATGSGDPLVSETVFQWFDEEYDQEWQDWEDTYMKPSKLIVVENGSFLLNLPLVNHEHRKIAGKLVDHVGPPSKRVVFLQSYAGGPPVRDADPTQGPSGLALFGIWPLSGILAHLALLGLVYAAARWPIFGVPKEIPPDSLTDFSAHVSALGQLLQETRNSAYARTTLLNYRQMTSGDDG